MAKLNSKLQELKDQSTQDILGVKVLDEAKFAELIVHRCANVCQNDDDSARILDAFGVK